MGPIARRCFAPAAVFQTVVIATGAIANDFHSSVWDVWWRNSFLDAVIHRPTEALPLVAGVTAIALCVAWFPSRSRFVG